MPDPSTIAPAFEAGVSTALVNGVGGGAIVDVGDSAFELTSPDGGVFGARVECDSTVGSDISAFELAVLEDGVFGGWVGCGAAVGLPG